MYGSTSAAARLSADKWKTEDAKAREQEVLAELHGDASALLLRLNASPPDDAAPVLGPVLHRWGSAFCSHARGIESAGPTPAPTFGAAAMARRGACRAADACVPARWSTRSWASLCAATGTASPPASSVYNGCLPPLRKSRGSRAPQVTLLIVSLYCRVEASAVSGPLRSGAQSSLGSEGLSRRATPRPRTKIPRRRSTLGILQIAKCGCGSTGAAPAPPSHPTTQCDSRIITIVFHVTENATPVSGHTTHSRATVLRGTLNALQPPPRRSQPDRGDLEEGREDAGRGSVGARGALENRACDRDVVGDRLQVLAVRAVEREEAQQLLDVLRERGLPRLDGGLRGASQVHLGRRHAVWVLLQVPCEARVQREEVGEAPTDVPLLAPLRPQLSRHTHPGSRTSVTGRMWLYQRASEHVARMPTRRVDVSAKRHDAQPAGCEGSRVLTAAIY